MARKSTKAAARSKRVARRSKRPAKPRRWGRRITTWCLVALIWLAVIGAGTLAWFAYDLPSVGSVAELTRRPSVTLVAADGSVLSSFGDVYGQAVELRQLPDYLPAAVLAIEDRRFYDHPGVDLFGVLRAAIANVRAGRIVQGGSTLTQQLAKNLFLRPDRTVRRKVQEMLLALWLEQRFSKDQILTLYLNRVYLGAGTFGVDAAARRYFAKPATEVSLYEAAVLAGLLKAPSRYNPARNPDLADRRAHVVLRAMEEAGMVDLEAAGEALSGKTEHATVSGWHARYFGDWVLAQIGGFVGEPDQDLVVQTTIDPRLQRIAERELAAILERDGAPRGAGQAAFVALSPNGAVRAMVGGHDYRTSQFNRAAQALRQPGSAFKAFVYLAALESGLGPDDRIVDQPVRVDGWSPGNYGDKYYGQVTLREAFARSLNSAAVRLSEQVGRATVVRAARRLGITSDLEATPSIALGTSEVTLLELTGAYAVFANQGRGVWPYGVDEIKTRSGRILFRREGQGQGPVVTPDNVARMTDLMAASVAWGSGKAADPGRPAAGKTGTSQDFRDAWFVGFTAELVAGAWFGNDDGSPMKQVTGGSLPAQLWHRILTLGLEGQPPEPLPGNTLRVARTSAPDGQGLPVEIRTVEAEDKPSVGLIESILDRLTGKSDSASEWYSGDSESRGR